MKPAKTTAFSGCIIWFVMISLIGSCILPVFIFAGSMSSFSEFAIKTTGSLLCPQGTTPQSHSYATTSIGSNGFERPSTGYELHCVDAEGNVVKKDPLAYAILWVGSFALIGVVVSALLSFVFAVPGGMLVTRLLEKFRVKKIGTPNLPA